jgi:hypothetical protein
LTQILLAAEAVQDLVDGMAFYESRQEGLGDYFLSCLVADIESLGVNAGIHRKAYQDYFRLLSRVFPSAVYYTREKESVRCAEQNLYAQAKGLVGDRDPRSHEYTVQVRAFDSNKSAAASGVGILLAMCSALLAKNLKGGLVVVGGLNLGGSVEPLYSPVVIAELAIEKGAKTLLVPVTARKQMNELADDQVTKINITYYTDAKDALMKAVSDI